MSAHAATGIGRLPADAMRGGGARTTALLRGCARHHITAGNARPARYARRLDVIAAMQDKSTDRIAVTIDAIGGITDGTIVGMTGATTGMIATDWCKM